MKYSTYHRNHAILPGREQALYDFLNAENNIGRKNQNDNSLIIH
jgi:hypothetical protein